MSLDRFLAGDDTQRDAAIVECMPLVDRAAEAFIRKAPGFSHLMDEFTSAGYAKLVELIPQLRDSSVNTDQMNPKGYLRTALKDVFIQTALDESHLGVPLRSWRRITARQNGVGKALPYSEHEHDRLDDPNKAADLRQTILDLCQSPDERMIVDMREQGFSNEEIAQELGLAEGSITKTLRDLEGRLNEELAA